MKIILITGFEPFGGERINPSGALLDHLPETVAGAALCKLLLPVSYRKSADLLLERIDALQPNALIMLGQAGGRGKITPECVAINLDHSESADNAGEQRINARIHPEAPAAYFATLPIDAMLQAMRACGVPCAMSVSAGAFVCNHVSFEALHHISSKGYGIPAGFIHLPYLPEQAEEKPGTPAMPLSMMEQGVCAALTAVAASIHA